MKSLTKTVYAKQFVLLAILGLTVAPQIRACKCVCDRKTVLQNIYGEIAYPLRYLKENLDKLNPSTPNLQFLKKTTNILPFLALTQKMANSLHQKTNFKKCSLCPYFLKVQRYISNSITESIIDHTKLVDLTLAQIMGEMPKEKTQELMSVQKKLAQNGLAKLLKKIKPAKE